MSYTHVIETEVTLNGAALISSRETVSSVGKLGYQESLTDPSDQLIDVDCTRAQVVSLIAVSIGADATIEINDNIGTGGLISLTDSVPFIYTENSGGTLSDVWTNAGMTALYITASGTTEITFDILQDNSA